MVALSTGGRVAGSQKRRRLVAKDSPRILTVARGAAYNPCPLPLISSRPFNSPDAASTLELVHVRRQRSGSPAVELCRRYRDRGAKRYGRQEAGPGVQRRSALAGWSGVGKRSSAVRLAHSPGYALSRSVVNHRVLCIGWLTAPSSRVAYHAANGPEGFPQ